MYIEGGAEKKVFWFETQMSVVQKLGEIQMEFINDCRGYMWT